MPSDGNFFLRKRNSHGLPNLVSNRGLQSLDSSQISTHVDSIEQRQAFLTRSEHQPKFGNMLAVKKRFQQQRPTLKLEVLDHSSEIDERELKSPNLVI